MVTNEVALFGLLLRQNRLAVGITQEELANRAGISLRAVSALERGVNRRPRLETVRLLVAALELEPAARSALLAAATGQPASMVAGEIPAASPAPHGGYLGALPAGPLVGREVELAQILAACDDLAGSGGRLILVAGEPGVGKTRLAQEVMIRAAERGYRVLAGRCYEEQVSLPFVEVLTAAVGLASPALQKEIPRRFPELSRLLPDLLSGGPALSPEADARPRTFHAASAFLEMLAAEAPIAVLLDDLHWADSTSLGLLLHLAHQLYRQPILLVGTYRDLDVQYQHPLEAFLATLLRERLVQEVSLHGLARKGTAALIGAHLGVPDVSDELIHLIHSRTEGNPFFIEELLTALVEQGAIARQGDTNGLANGGFEAPRSIRSVVGQRVGRLAPAGQELLRVASVLGQEWDLDVLLGAMAQPEDAVLDQLEAALAARLLEERRIGQQERYAFAHALIQQVLYEEIPRFRLRRLHLRAGEALERARGQRPETAAELARHFMAAGDEERAILYSIRAGDHAVHLCAPAEAARLYEAALEYLTVAGDAARTAGVRRARGAALDQLNRLVEARAEFETALQTYLRLGDAVGQALVHRDIALMHMVRSEMTDAAGHLDQALALWPAEREDADLVQLLLHGAFCKAAAGDAARAASLRTRGLALAEQVGNPVLLAWAAFLDDSTAQPNGLD